MTPSLKDVLKQIKRADYEKAYARHTNGPDDSVFKLTRPFASQVASMMALAGKLSGSQHNYAADGGERIYVELPRGQNGIIDLKSWSYYPGSPVNKIKISNGEHRHCTEKLEVGFLSPGWRFSHFSFESSDPGIYEEISGSKSLDSPEDTRFKVVRFSVNNDGALNLMFNTGREDVRETLDRPTDWKGKRPSSIFEDALKRFGIPPRL